MIRNAVLGALVASSLLGQGTAGEPNKSIADPYRFMFPTFNLTDEKEHHARTEMTRRTMLFREGFSNSQQAKLWPDTMGKFLGRKEYARMSGNTLIGYWWVSPNFLWKSEYKSIEFTAPIGVHPSSKAIQPAAWDKALQIYSGIRGWHVGGPAPIKITGAVVGATLDPKEDHTRGYATICEWRIQSPEGGELVYRYAVMKPSLGAAIGANLDWVLSFASSIDGQRKKVGNKEFIANAEGLNSVASKR